MASSCEVKPRPKSVKEFFTTWYFWKPFIGVVSGLLAGFLYFHFVECKECSWTINREVFSTMLFGGFLGFFVTGSPCARFGK